MPTSTRRLTVCAAAVVAFVAAWGLDAAQVAAGSFTVRSPVGNGTFNRPTIGGGPRGGGGTGGGRTSGGETTTSTGGGTVGGWSRGVPAHDPSEEAERRERERQQEFIKRLANATQKSEGLQQTRATGVLQALDAHALGQLRRARQSGGEIRSLCFDLGKCVPVASSGTVDVKDVVAAHQQGRPIPEAVRQKHPEITGWEKDRSAARAEIATLQREIEQLQTNPSANAMEIYKCKEKERQMESKVAWDTYQIEQYVLLPN
jgi:hypothetical protein